MLSSPTSARTRAASPGCRGFWRQPESGCGETPATCGQVRTGGRRSAVRSVTAHSFSLRASLTGPLSRDVSYQREELELAVEQLRLRSPDDPWLIPVRLDDCEIPDRDIGGGRTLTSIQRADLFGSRRAEGTVRLVTMILQILGR